MLPNGAVVVKDRGGNVLTEGVNYRLVYSNNDVPGTATVTVEGINTHSGTLKASFTVKLAEAVDPVDPTEPTEPTDPGTDNSTPTSSLPTAPAPAADAVHHSLVRTGANTPWAVFVSLILVAGGVALIARWRNVLDNKNAP